MANALYPKWKESLLTLAANNDYADGTVKVYLIDLADYTYSASHQFASDIATAAAKVATSAALGSKTITNGVADAADFSFGNVTGDPSEALIVWIDTGTQSTSPLVAYYDTGVTGLPVTPNGGPIDVQFNASGLFAL